MARGIAPFAAIFSIWTPQASTLEICCGALNGGFSMATAAFSSASSGRLATGPSRRPATAKARR